MRFLSKYSSECIGQIKPCATYDSCKKEPLLEKNDKSEAKLNKMQQIIKLMGEFIEK